MAHRYSASSSSAAYPVNLRVPLRLHASNESGDISVFPLHGGTAAETIGVAHDTVTGDVRLGPGFARLNGRAIEPAGTGRTVLRVRTVGGDLSARMAAPLAALRETLQGSSAAAPAPDPGGDPGTAGALPDEPATVGTGHRAAGPGVATSAALSASSPDPADRLDVLRQLAEGVIGIDEAMRVLDGPDASARQPGADTGQDQRRTLLAAGRDGHVSAEQVAPLRGGPDRDR